MDLFDLLIYSHSRLKKITLSHNLFQPNTLFKLFND